MSEFGLLTTLIFIFIALLCTTTDALRLNCGGPAIPGFTGDSPAFYGGTRRGAFGSGSILNSHAYGPRLVYRFRVAPSKPCFVAVRFAETYRPNGRPGGRVMSVSIGGVTTNPRFDAYVAAGNRLGTAATLSRRFTAPRNGIVQVVVASVSGDRNAMISNIDIWGGNAGKAGPGYGGSNPNPNPNPNPPPPPPSGRPRLTGASKFTLLSSNGAPTKRHESCAVLTRGKIYLIGGRGFKPVDVYDLRTNTWTRKGGPDVEMNHFQCVAYGTKIYAVGAWYGPFPREKTHTKVHMYNTENDSWSTVAGPRRKRGGGATVVYGNKLYTAGGNVGGHGAHAKSVTWFDSMDLKTGVWTQLADMPRGTARDHTGGAVVGNKMCVIGGRNGGVSNFWGTPVSSIVCFNFQTGKWTTMRSTLPAGRAGSATGTTCDGYIMVAGGEGRRAGTTSGGSAFARVDLYNPNTDSFGPVQWMKRARHGTGLCVARCKCGNIYIPSGSGGLGGSPELASVEVFTPDGRVRTGAECL